MYCPKCGNKISDNETICDICGEDLGKRRKNMNIEETREIQKIEDFDDCDLNKSSFLKYKKKILIGSVVVIAAVIVLAGFYIHKNSKIKKEKVAVETNANNKENTTKKNTKSKSKIEELPATTIKNSDFKDKTTNDNSSKDSSYIFNDSSTRYLEDYELENLSVENLSLARNEIFARHGYVFHTEPYKSYFSNKRWYVEDSTFKADEENLNQYENYNVQLFLKYEKNN